MEQGMKKYIVDETENIGEIMIKALEEGRHIHVEYIGKEYCCLIGEISESRLISKSVTPSSDVIKEFMQERCITIGKGLGTKGISTKGFLDELNLWLNERGYSNVTTRWVKPLIYNMGYPAIQGIATDTNSKTSLYRYLGWK